MDTNSNKKRFHNKKPNLVYLSCNKTLNEFPFNHKQYRESIIEFLKLCNTKFNVFFVNGLDKHLGRGIFSSGYKIVMGKFIPYNNKIFSKVVFNKGPLHSNGNQDWGIINKWNLMKSMQSKYNTFRIFKKFMKPSYRIKNAKEFDIAIKKIKTNRAVYKPDEGSAGKGILISSKKTIKKKMVKYNGILQEFIDTSGGISKIYNSYHDMRLLIMDGKIVQSYVRIPKKGKFIANIAQGGKMLEIKKSMIPSKALIIVKKIDNYYKKFGSRVYAIDFGFENNIPFLIELNSQPGIPYKSWKMYYQAWHKGLLNTLYKSI